MTRAVAATGPEIDGERLLRRLQELAACSAGPGPGVTRLAWSQEWRAAVELVSRWAADAGGDVRVDAVGNVIAEIAGELPDGPVVVIGSHLDTVPQSGPLDGAYGLVGAIEVAAALHHAGVAPPLPLRLVAYNNEEGVVAPAFTGSRAIAGLLDPAELAGRVEIAAGPDVGKARWTVPVRAVLELHVEQGPVLDTAGFPIGVVTAITGQQRGVITVTGSANHAGTTPMAMRRDALVAAAQLVLAVRALAGPAGVEVATVGRLQVEPGVGNVIPGKAELTFDLRSVDDSRLPAGLASLRGRAVEIAGSTGTEIDVSASEPTPAVATDAALREVIEKAAADLGLQSARLSSGAGHDGAVLAGLAPVAMIFVPSRDGVSHHHRETTDDPDLVAGAQVLLRAVMAIGAGHG